MKFKAILAACLAGAAFTAMAQNDGVEYYKADQFDNAKELLLRSIDNPSTDKAVANYYLGLIALQENNASQAAAYFEKGAQANPEYPFNYTGLGQIELSKGNKSVAESQFKLAEKYGKKDAALQIAIARAYYDVDPVVYADQIRKRVEKARKIDMNEPALYIFEGDCQKDVKDWGAAAAKYEMAANYNPNATEAFVKYANLFTQVNPDYAVTMLKKLLESNPSSALGQREIANAYFNKGDFANAAIQYGSYVKNPNHFKQDEDRYAFLLFYGQKYKDGYEYATRLLQNNPDNFTAQRYQFMNAAQLPEMKDQILQMAENLYANHTKNPENKFAAIDYTLIADEMQRAKRPDEALDVLKEGCTQIEDNGNLIKQMAMVYIDKNDMQSAADTFAKYLDGVKDPGFNDNFQQATLYFYSGVENKKENSSRSESDFNKALEYAARAKAIMPSSYRPKKIEGDVAKQRASSEKEIVTVAAPYYMEAVELLEKSADPKRYSFDAKEMYNYLGNYYLEIKDTPKAKEFFNKYLEYDPNNDAYRKFVDNLK